MKKTIALMIWLLGISVSGQNNTSDPEARDRELLRTYGYCYGQQRSVDQIKADFPSLSVAMFQAQTAFDVTFGKSCQAVAAEFPTEIKRELNSKFDQLLPRSVITEVVARDFIEKIHARAKGEIETPVKETLLAFNPDFRRSPGLEFMRGYTRVYSTLNHAKAKGLHLEIKLPASWMSREGNRPNVVQFFKSEYGRNDPSAIIMVQQFTPPRGIRVTQSEIDSLFSASGLKSFVPDDAKVLESKPIVLEGLKGGMWVFEMSADRLDVSITMRTLQYVIFYKNRLIFLQFSSGGTPDNRSLWTASFEKNRPLFQMVANSLVIVDKYNN
ncbi:MAG: hypothetical protein KF756_10730 [Acidobacteria bacterium]|nr:hypothetical protein [Acidobacteriota bacterium]